MNFLYKIERWESYIGFKTNFNSPWILKSGKHCSEAGSSPKNKSECLQPLKFLREFNAFFFLKENFFSRKYTEWWWWRIYHAICLSFPNTHRKKHRSSWNVKQKMCKVTGKCCPKYYEKVASNAYLFLVLAGLKDHEMWHCHKQSSQCVYFFLTNTINFLLVVNKHCLYSCNFLKKIDFLS